jgi:hypothetical protein
MLPNQLLFLLPQANISLSSVLGNRADYIVIETLAAVYLSLSRAVLAFRLKLLPVLSCWY